MNKDESLSQSESFSSAESIEENEDKFKNFVKKTTKRIDQVIANRRASRVSNFAPKTSIKSQLARKVTKSSRRDTSQSIPSYASSSTITKYLRIKGEAQERQFVDDALDVLIHHQEFQKRKDFELRRRPRIPSVAELDIGIQALDSVSEPPKKTTVLPTKKDTVGGRRASQAPAMLRGITRIRDMDTAGRSSAEPSTTKGNK